jgi:hypothetical protein
MDAEPEVRTGPRDDFFFIVGAGRSGTTLLQTLLSAHPRLTVPPETHYVKRAMDWGAGHREGPADFDAFWEALVDWSRFKDLGIDARDVMARVDRDGGRTFRAVFTAILDTYGADRGARRVGEKTPSHCRHVARLLTWYPDARVLFVRRDPRAVVASQLATPWVAEQRRPASPLASFTRRLRLAHVADRAALWRTVNGHFLEACEDDPRVRVVDYETLVTAPDETLRDVCDFLGEAYEATILSGRDGTGSGAGASGDESFEDWRRAHREAARGPVTRSSLVKWETALTSLEIAMIEAICDGPMRAAGYEARTGGRLRGTGRAVAGTYLGALRLEDRMRGIAETQ